MGFGTVYRSICTSEYPYGRGERGLVKKNPKEIYIYMVN
jgi:hypothetical protein